MKRVIELSIVLTFLASVASAQGLFAFNNQSARTRIGSADGPFAYSGIWAQMLAGVNPDGLSPIGDPREHLAFGPGGLVVGPHLEVPGIPPCGIAYVKMAAWEGELWGTSLAGVPPEWLGMTDTVRVILGGGPIPCELVSIPRFTQPAIVPIPEPPTSILGLLGGATLLVASRCAGCLAPRRGGRISSRAPGRLARHGRGLQP
jgi:hypothetical protein